MYQPAGGPVHVMDTRQTRALRARVLFTRAWSFLPLGQRPERLDTCTTLLLLYTYSIQRYNIQLTTSVLARGLVEASSGYGNHTVTNVYALLSRLIFETEVSSPRQHFLLLVRLLEGTGRNWKFLGPRSVTRGTGGGGQGCLVRSSGRNGDLLAAFLIT